jgi:uncharacterized protein YkwD
MVIRTSKPEWRKVVKDKRNGEVRQQSPCGILQKQHENLLNSIRSSHGLKPIINSKKLNEIEYLYATEMAESGNLSHVGPDGSDFSTRALRGGYKGFPRAENIAWNYANLETVVAGWMTSPGHRENILISDVNDVGIGYFQCVKHEHWWVQLFGN